jgi:hypothetical protein
VVELFSSRRILNGMKNSSRKRVGKIEKQYGIEMIQVGKIDVQAIGEYLYVKKEARRKIYVLRKQEEGRIR